MSRRLTFDEDKSSPVSGTLIRELADGEEIPMYQTGTIRSYNLKKIDCTFELKILEIHFSN